MPRYELVLNGVLSEGSMAGPPGFSYTTDGATTVLRTRMDQDDLTRVLETLEALGLGLVSLRQVDAAWIHEDGA
jgi:hypothetical protein